MAYSLPFYLRSFVRIDSYHFCKYLKKKCIYMGTLKSLYDICLGLYLFVLLVCQVEFSSF